METTSNRRQAFAQPQSNPATKFLEWKSNDQCFEYYDKEAQKKVQVTLPFKFLVLDEGYAETPEAAEKIMVNMSEEWRDSIIG